MAVSYFIYVTDKENTGFDLEKFNNDIKQRFPGVSVEVKSDENSFLKVVKVPKTKGILFDKFDEIIRRFQFGVRIG